MTTTTDLASSPARRAKKTRIGLTRMERAERRFAFLMLVPALVIVFAIMAFPWGYSFWLSLNELNIFTKQWTFVGLHNYLTALPEPASISAFLRTVWFSAGKSSFTATIAPPSRAPRLAGRRRCAVARRN